MLFSQYWLAWWSSQPPAKQQQTYWVWGYGIMTAVILAISLVRSLVFFRYSLRWVGERWGVGVWGGVCGNAPFCMSGLGSCLGEQR